MPSLRCAQKHRRAITLITTLALLSGAARADDLRSITLDASHAIGTLKPLSGANGVPEPGRSKPFGYGGRTPRDPNIDVSAGYRAAHITLIRTHDSYGAADIDAKFAPPALASPFSPHVPASFNADDIFPDMTADPANPASYNFAPTDKAIASILAIGAEPLFRIGRSEGAQATAPDPVQYAAIVRHIVMHYNKLWDHGFKDHIRLWEVWNEPDLANLFYDGTPQQFYALYDAVARAIKSADPQAQVGGPPLSRPLDNTPYREGFLDHVRANRVPYDFQPFHFYSLDDGDPYLFGLIAGQLDQVIKSHGFAHIPLVLDEWNGAWFYSGKPDPAAQSAYIVSALIAMQDAPIAAQTIYRADDAFGADGATPDGVGQGLVANGMMAATPQRLAITGGDANGLAVEAGRSRDGKTIQLLLANYQIPASDMAPRKGGDIGGIPGVVTILQPPRRAVNYSNNGGYDLTISGLKPTASYRVERFRASPGHALALLDQQTLTANQLHLTAPLPPPAVELIRLTLLAAP